MVESGRCSVLVVEDDPSVSDFVESLLVSEGFEVRLARDGEEALQEIDRARPDLILLDLRLPGMSGVTFLRRLRERPGPYVPVILTTAAPEETELAKETGAEGVLVKPFGLAEFMAEVRQVVGRTTCPAERAPGQE
ncbi:MAG: response regulator [Anaerolineae bacterium]|nr:response regulator [Anaerolineae bacterium]